MLPGPTVGNQPWDLNLPLLPTMSYCSQVPLEYGTLVPPKPGKLWELHVFATALAFSVFPQDVPSPQST